MPGPTSAKNAALQLGAAAADLGGEDWMLDELTDEEQRRRRLKEGKAQTPGNFGDAVMGNAAMSLFNGIKG